MKDNLSNFFIRTHIYMSRRRPKPPYPRVASFVNPDYLAALTMNPAAWFRNPDYPDHLTMIPASGLRLHGPRYRNRGSGVGRALPRSLNPAPRFLPPEALKGVHWNMALNGPRIACAASHLSRGSWDVKWFWTFRDILSLTGKPQLIDS